MNGEHRREVEIIVLCEGYLDRAFLAGVAEAAGWPKPARDAAGQVVVRDLDGVRIRGGGRYYFVRQTDGLQSGLLLQPCVAEMTRKQVAQQVEAAFVSKASDIASKTRRDRPRCVFVCVDADTDAGESVDVRAISERKRLLGLLVRQGINAALKPDHRIWLGDATAWAVPLIWHAGDKPGTKGVPDKQTLERIVCAAMAEAYPDRAAHVQGWLDGRPPEDDLPPAVPKSYCWSHMAAWSAEFGAEGFIREAIWRSQARDALMSRVAACAGGRDLLDLLSATSASEWMSAL